MRSALALLGGLLIFQAFGLGLPAFADGTEQPCIGAACQDYKNAHAKPKPYDHPRVCYKFEQQQKDAVTLTILDVQGLTLPADHGELGVLLDRLINDPEHKKYVVYQPPAKVAGPFDQYCFGRWRVVQAVQRGYLIVLCNGVQGGNKKALFRPSDSSAILKGEYRRACLAGHCEHATHSF